jgi:hypothetical protein
MCFHFSASSGEDGLVIVHDAQLICAPRLALTTALWAEDNERR